MNIVLILAGGTGSRVGANVPKQFINVNNKPIIIYTLEKFEKNDNIDLICVCCHREWLEQMKSYINDFKISKALLVVEGGATGLESVYNGIQAIKGIAEKHSIVLIHDGVRPFISQGMIDDNIEVAKKNGNAMSAIPLVETLAFSEDGVVSSKTVNRDNLYRIQTPQTFRLSDLLELYSDSRVLESTHPSTFSLYMSKGYPIYISKGSEKNIKITYTQDIKYFKKFFE